MKETDNSELRLDLSCVNWHAYEDCYGTSEEKYLKVHTREGDFLMYYCRVKGSEDGNGMIVIGPNGLDAWYVGVWEVEWKPRMLEMRRFSTYRDFLNHTCICRTNNINSWLI